MIIETMILQHVLRYILSNGPVSSKPETALLLHCKVPVLFFKPPDNLWSNTSAALGYPIPHYLIALSSTDYSCLNQLLHCRLENGDFSTSIIHSTFISQQPL